MEVVIEELQVQQHMLDGIQFGERKSLLNEGFEPITQSPVKSFEMHSVITSILPHPVGKRRESAHCYTVEC